MPSLQMIFSGNNKTLERHLLLVLVILHWNVEDSFMVWVAMSPLWLDQSFWEVLINIWPIKLVIIWKKLESSSSKKLYQLVSLWIRKAEKLSLLNKVMNKSKILLILFCSLSEEVPKPKILDYNKLVLKQHKMEKFLLQMTTKHQLKIFMQLVMYVMVDLN